MNALIHTRYSRLRIFFRRPVRSIVQLFFLAIFIGLIIFIIDPTEIHEICPWAIVESPILATLVSSNLFWISGMIIGLVGIIGTLFYPRPFCGWICPLGTLFDFLGDLGRKLRIVAKPVPHWLNEKMRYFSFGVLIIVVLGTIVSKRVICIYGCPIYWLCAMWKLSIPLLTAIFVLFVLLLSMRVKRVFCRYICIYGALTSIFSAFARKRIYRNLEVCDNCTLCRVCPMGIDVLYGLVVESRHCISCGECVYSCVKSALSWKKVTLEIDRRKNG